MNDLLDAEEKAALAEEIPAGRFGTPEEVALLAWQLANAPALPGRYWVWTEDISNSYSQILSHFA